MLFPAYSPMRSYPPQPRPRYTPPPLPEGFARVELDVDYDTGERFTDWAAEDAAFPARVFDVPREQYDRWVTARDAYAAMQEEIAELRAERLRTPGFAPDGWVREDKP